jgi:hypothetical protein
MYFIFIIEIMLISLKLINLNFLSMLLHKLLIKVQLTAIPISPINTIDDFFMTFYQLLFQELILRVEDLELGVHVLVLELLPLVFLRVRRLVGIVIRFFGSLEFVAGEWSAFYAFAGWFWGVRGRGLVRFREGAIWLSGVYVG